MFGKKVIRKVNKNVVSELNSLELAINRYKVAQNKISEKEILISQLSTKIESMQLQINEYKNVMKKLNDLFIALTISKETN